MSKNAMYCRVYRLRHNKKVKIDTRNRTIHYAYQQDEKLMDNASIKVLCKQYGFVRQSYFE